MVEHKTFCDTSLPVLVVIEQFVKGVALLAVSAGTPAKES